MKNRAACRTAVLLILGVILSSNARGRVFEVAPGEDYRRLLRGLEAGDELVFLPGEHVQHATVKVAGTADRPVIIRGQLGPDGQRPEIRWLQRGQNTWDVRGDHLQIRDLCFHNAHHYGMRVRKAKHLTIQNCLFRDNGGGDLSVNSGEAISVHVLDCRFIGGKRTPVYVGNHSGKQVVKDFRFERNVVDGSQINEQRVIGYGIQLKLNVDGVIRNNFIRGSQGPAIMVYGFEDAEAEGQQRVENNLVVAARNSANIVVGGGPATVRRNLVLKGLSGGIHLIDYGGRDLLEGVDVRENLLVAGRGRALSVSSKARRVRVFGNQVNVALEKDGPRNRLASANTADNESSDCDPALLAAVNRLAAALQMPASAEVVQVSEQIEHLSFDDPAQLAHLLRQLAD